MLIEAQDLDGGSWRSKIDNSTPYLGTSTPFRHSGLMMIA
jgi:hypothetical protein